MGCHRQRDIDIPAGTVSAHLQSPGGDSPEVANRILRLLKSPDAVIEVSLNSNLFLVADTLAERRSTLADFVSWLLQHKLNFFFGYDEPALHEANWLEAGNLCKCHKPWLPEKSKPTWYSEWTALHLVPDLAASDVAAARTCNRKAAFGSNKRNEQGARAQGARGQAPPQGAWPPAPAQGARAQGARVQAPAPRPVRSRRKVVVLALIAVGSIFATRQAKHA